MRRFLIERIEIMLAKNNDILFKRRNSSFLQKIWTFKASNKFKKMKIKILLQIVSRFALADLIGFNRMRNNMYNHYTTRVKDVRFNKYDFDAEADYKRKILMFLKFHKQWKTDNKYFATIIANKSWHKTRFYLIWLKKQHYVIVKHQTQFCLVWIDVAT